MADLPGLHRLGGRRPQKFPLIMNEFLGGSSLTVVIKHSRNYRLSLLLFAIFTSSIAVICNNSHFMNEASSSTIVQWTAN